MKFNPEKHHRRSIRLKGYDYAQSGVYFITICTQNRDCLFGKIVDGSMWLNDAGQMVAIAWQQLPERFLQVAIEAFVVMPNHLHGIIIITELSDVGAVRKCAALALWMPLSTRQGHPQGWGTLWGRLNPSQHTNIQSVCGNVIGCRFQGSYGSAITMKISSVMNDHLITFGNILLIIL